MRGDCGSSSRSFFGSQADEAELPHEPLRAAALIDPHQHAHGAQQTAGA